MKTTMKQPVSNSTTTYRKYDPSFKQESVELWLQSGKSARMVGEELGIAPERLYAWKHDFTPLPQGGKGGSGVKNRRATLESENIALRRENELLRQQRDILKKTLGILSEPPRNALPGSKP